MGVNPYRPLNAEYRAFFAVVARQIRVALGDTLAYEAERLRVQVLADLDRAKMEFFQNVSHELRTPADGAAGAVAGPAGRSADQPPAEQQDLQAAVRAAERLRTMVDALLDFSGAEAGALDPDRQPTDLAALTATGLQHVPGGRRACRPEVEVQVPDAPVTAAVDRAMWSTIVTNLVSNAVKYTRRAASDPAVRRRTPRRC